MMKWWKIFAKRHKGFSIVELICAVAILSIVVTGAGSAMVISARSYQRGNIELDLQQQAQITANLLTNLIIDSDKVEEPGTVGSEGSQLSVRKIETETVTDEDGNTSLVAVNYRYTVTTDGSDADNPKLVYTREKVQVDDSGAIEAVLSSESNTLAEHISAFTIKRVADNNFDFSLKVVSTTGKTFESDYHVTPRNEVSGSAGSALSGAKSIWVENELILEPNQTYDLNVRITGTSIQGYTIQGLTGNTSSDTSVSNTAQIKLGASETGSGPEAMFSFNVVPNDTAIAPINVKVYVRRINDIDVNGVRTSGTVNRAGGYYKVTAPLSGTSLERKLGAWYDADYVNPYQITWSYEFTKLDEDGNETHPDYNQYVEIIGSPGIDENNIPYVIFRLKQDMTSGCEFKVTATALHPEGAKLQETPTEIWSNKSHERYGKVSDVMASVSDSWTLGYQAWKRNGKLDIAIHHLDDENFWIMDGQIMYKWNARVKFSAYDSAGNFLPAISGDFDPWQREQHLPIKADLDLNNIRDKWDLTLMPYHETNQAWDWGPAYSLPYILAYYDDRTFDRNFYIYNASPSFVNTGLGVAGYRIELYYEYMDENGILQNETIIENYEVEEVSVLYRNALDVGCSWQRDNIIFVTPEDTITDYKVHFRFDRGWDKDDSDYHFIDFKRFVGVVADRPGYINDVRRDITVTGNDKKKDVPDGDSVLTFTLTAADKAECKALADAADGTIKVIYEYNPFLARLPLQVKSDSELLAENPEWADNFWGNYDAAVDADPLNPRWYKEYDMPLNVGGVILTQETMDSIKGCPGSVVFCFKDKNITGASLKAMYCPTLAEYGPVYYIDDIARFTIQATTAQYQELVGGTWSTVVNLTWNGSGWIAN